MWAALASPRALKRPNWRRVRSFFVVLSACVLYRRVALRGETRRGWNLGSSRERERDCVVKVFKRSAKKQSCELAFLGKEEIVAAVQVAPRERKPKRAEVFEDRTAFPPPGNGATEPGLESAWAPCSLALHPAPTKNTIVLPPRRKTRRGKESGEQAKTKGATRALVYSAKEGKNKGFDLRRLTKGAWNWRSWRPLCPSRFGIRGGRWRSRGGRKKNIRRCMASTLMLPRSVVACRQQPLTYRECSEDLEKSHLVACRDSESFARAAAAWSKLASGRHRRRRRRRGRFFVSFSVFLMKTLQSNILPSSFGTGDLSPCVARDATIYRRREAAALFLAGCASDEERSDDAASEGITEAGT